jgi:hypothetical protein
VVIGNRKLKKGRQFNGPKRKKDKHVIHKTLQGKLLPLKYRYLQCTFVFHIQCPFLKNYGTIRQLTSDHIEMRGPLQLRHIQEVLRESGYK